MFEGPPQRFAAHRPHQHRQHIHSIKRQDPEHVPAPGQDQGKRCSKNRQQPLPGQRFKPVIRAQQGDHCSKSQAKGIRHAVGGRPQKHGPQHHNRHTQRVIQRRMASGQLLGQVFCAHQQRKPHGHKAGDGIAHHKRIDAAPGKEIRHTDKEIHEHLIVRRQQAFQQHMNAVKSALTKAAEQQCLLGKIVDRVITVHRLAVAHQCSDDCNAHSGASQPTAQERFILCYPLTGEHRLPGKVQQQAQPAHADSPHQHHQQHAAIGCDHTAHQNGTQQQHAIRQPAWTGRECAKVQELNFSHRGGLLSPFIRLYNLFI